jgi:hypothetical protein
MARPLAPRVRDCPDPSRVAPSRGPTSWCDRCEKAVHNLSNLGDDDARRVLADPTACVRFDRTRAGRVARAVSVAVAIAASTPAAGASRIEVLVIDPDGIPVPGARVVARLDDREVMIYADDAGIAHFSADGEAYFSVNAVVEEAEPAEVAWKGRAAGPMWAGVERVVIQVDHEAPSPRGGPPSGRVGNIREWGLTEADRLRWRARPIAWFKGRNLRLVPVPARWRRLLPADSPPSAHPDPAPGTGQVLTRWPPGSRSPW